MDRIPKQSGIYLKVYVNQSIAEGTHQVPGYPRMIFFYLPRNLVGCLADDDEIELDSPDGPYIVLECLEVEALSKALDFIDRIEDILDAFEPASRRHRRVPTVFAGAGEVLSYLACPNQPDSREDLRGIPARRRGQTARPGDQIRPARPHRWLGRPDRVRRSRTGLRT